MRTTIYGRLLLALILCLIQSAGEAQQTPLYTLKWTTDSYTDMPLVRVTMSDGKARLFGFSPMQSNTILDRSLAKDLHLMVSTGKRGGTSFEYVTSTMEIGPDGLYLPKVPFLLADLAFVRQKNPDIAGIIGSNILHNFTVLLDYSKQQMDLLPGSVAGTSYQPKDAIRLPLQYKDEQYFLKAALDGKVLRFVINTLSDRIYLCAADLKSLKPKAVIKFPQAGETSNGVATVGSRALRFTSLQFGSVTLDNPIFETDTTSDNSLSELGNDFFKCYHVVFDFPASALYLTPDPSFHEDPRKWVGIGLYRDETKSNIVSGVSSPSAAEEAGIARGDEIVSIDGHSLKGLSEEEIDKLMKPTKQLGATVTLEILPANHSGVRTVKLQPRPLL